MSSTKVSCGCIYCLYLIHGTQLIDNQKAIPTSPILWERLREVVLAAKKEGVNDVEAILCKMVQKKAFYFSLLVEVLAPPEYWPISHSPGSDLIAVDTLTGVLDVKALDVISHDHQRTLVSEAQTNQNISQLSNKLNEILYENSRYIDKDTTS